MTSQQRTTPRNTHPELSEPCLTVKRNGKYYCNCQTFMTNALLFQEGSCQHTRRAAVNEQLVDLASAPDPEPASAEYDAWLEEQARQMADERDAIEAAQDGAL